MRVRFKIPMKFVELREKSEHFFHCTYLGAVGYEAHGLYKWAAIVLLCVTISGVFMVREMEEGDEQ